MVLQYAVSDHCRVDDCRALIVYRRNILYQYELFIIGRIISMLDWTIIKRHCWLLIPDFFLLFYGLYYGLYPVWPLQLIFGFFIAVG